MTGQIIRPVGWQAQNDIPASFTRPGHLYRGMTEQEYLAHKKAGYIQSTGRYSFAEEGTNFSDRADDAEGYVNFGREDPRKTGRPNYLIEVRNDPSVFTLWRDGYYKTPQRIPLGCITRVWIMFAKDGAIVAQDTSLTREERNPTSKTIRRTPDIEDAAEYYWFNLRHTAELDGTVHFCPKSSKMPIGEILNWDDYSSWGGFQQGELVGMPQDELRAELNSYRQGWAERAMRWLEDGSIPPVVLVEALRDRGIADGRGRVSLAVGMNIPELEVIVLKQCSPKRKGAIGFEFKDWYLTREDRNPSKSYLYHETRRDSLRDIKQEGLLPLSYGQWFVGEQGEVLSPDAFEEEELEDAPEEDFIQRLYVMTSEPKGLKYGDFLLRFPREAGGKLEHDVDPYVLSQIPAELIEIRVDGAWKPLSEEKNPRPIPIDMAKIKDLAKKLTKDAVVYAKEHQSDLPPHYGHSMAYSVIEWPRADGSMRKVRIKLELMPEHDPSQKGIGRYVRSAIWQYGMIDIEIFAERALRDLSSTHIGSVADIILRSDLEHVLEHELTHVSDPDKSPRKYDLGGTSPQSVYVNDPREVRAFGRMIVNEVLDRAKNPKRMRWARERDKPLVMSLLGTADTWNEVKDHLSPENQNKVLLMVERSLRDAGVDTQGKGEMMNPSPRKPKTSPDLIPEALRAVADRIYAAGLHRKFGARDVLAWMVGDKPRLGFRGPSLSIENHVLAYDHRMMGNYSHGLDVQIQRAFFPADPVLSKRGEGVTGGRGQRLDEPDTEMGDVIVMMEQLLSELILGDPDGGASVVILPDEGAPHVPGQSQTPYYSAKTHKVLVGREPAGTTIGQTPRWEVVEYGVLTSADEYAYSINPCHVAKTVDPGPVDREVFGMFRDGLRVMISHSFDPTVERKEAAKGIVECSGLIYPSLSIGPIPAANFGKASLISLVPPVIQRLRPYADKKRGAHEIVVYDTDAWTGRTSEAAGVQAAILWAQLTGNWSPPPYTDVHMWTLGPQITEGPVKAKTIRDTKALHTLVKRVTRAWKRGTALSDLERHIAANEKSYYGYGEVKVQGIYPLSAFPLCVAAGDVAEQTRAFLKSISWAGSLIILPQKNPGDINMDLLDHAWQVSDAVHQYAEKHRLVMAINQ